MLVLTRRIGEVITVGEDVRITLVRVNSRGEVRIGVDAPKGTPINRQEVLGRIKRDKDFAASDGWVKCRSVDRCLL